MALLVVGIVACLAVFFQMDKKDKVIIQEFVDSTNASAAEQKQQPTQE